MKIDRIQLADIGEPVKLAATIHRLVGEIPLPIPVEEIASSVGIQDIRPLETDGFEGGLIANAEKTEGIILVADKARTHRRRFTIGHEIGHFINPWHKPVQGTQFFCSASDMNLTGEHKSNRAKQMEVEANEFSAELLMPRRRFLRHMRQRAGADLEHIFEIAGLFSVSKEAAARRYIDLNDEPCGVIFSKDGHIRYSYRNREFPYISVSAKTRLPTESLSANYRGAVGRISEWQLVSEKIWISSRSGQTLYEQTVCQRDGYQITLLTVDDETEEDAELEESWTPRFRK